MKVASLTEEVIRRLKHTSLELPHSSRMEALEKLTQKMSNNGHMGSFMKRIMIKGIVKFEITVFVDVITPMSEFFDGVEQYSI